MCSFHYVSDISGYTEALYHPKTVQLEGPFLLVPPMLCKDWQEPFQQPFQRPIFHMKTKLKDKIEFRKLVRKLFLNNWSES